MKKCKMCGLKFKHLQGKPRACFACNEARQAAVRKKNECDFCGKPGAHFQADGMGGSEWMCDKCRGGGPETYCGAFRVVQARQAGKECELCGREADSLRFLPVTEKWVCKGPCKVEFPSLTRRRIIERGQPPPFHAPPKRRPSKVESLFEPVPGAAFQLKPETPSDPWPEDVLRRIGKLPEKAEAWQWAIGAMVACMLMAALLVASYVALWVGPRGDADQEVRDTGWVEISDGNLVYGTGPLPARIPPELKTKHLSDLAIGESAWAVPWAMGTDGHGLWLDPSHTAQDDQWGTYEMLVTRTAKGYEVDLNRCMNYTWSEGARPITPVLDVVRVTSPWEEQR